MQRRPLEAARRAAGGVGLALVAAMATATPARADLVHFVAEGTVFSLQDSHGILDPSVALDAPMRATISYDTEAADSFPDPDVGVYLQSIPPAQLRVEVGVYTIDVPGAYQVTIVDDGLFADEITYRREGNPFPFAAEPGVVLDFVNVTVQDVSSTALASDALPLAPPTISAFPTAQIDITGCLEEEVTGVTCDASPPLAVRALVTSLPEPAAGAPWACAALALRALAARRRTPARAARIAPG